VGYEREIPVDVLKI